MELVEHVDVPHPGDGGWPDRGSLLQLLALSNNGGFKYNYKYKYYNCWVKCPSNIVGYNSNITLFLLQCLVGLFVNLCNLPASWWPILYKWYLHISPTTCGWDACGWANRGSLLKTSSTTSLVLVILVPFDILVAVGGRSVGHCPNACCGYLHILSLLPTPVLGQV